MPPFQLHSEFQPAGDQPKAIAALFRGLKENRRDQVLLGVTGSGKTFTMANVIAEAQRPTLVLSHNKTLAAQLYGEFRDFFPNNAVAYFVSYYDYYQPEAYIPQRDIYIEKDASINEEIDRLRLAATSALVSRRDVIVVATVSCIYGLGSPKDYLEMMIPLRVGESIDRDDLLRRLIDIQYDRNDYEFARGKFRVRGDVVECWPAYEEFAYRLELWGDQIESLSEINPVTGAEARKLNEIYIYPAKHFVLPQDRINMALEEIREELEERLAFFRREGKLLEAQRLAARTRYDIEMMQEAGFCPGIENYSRPLAGRKVGEPPYTLFDFFPKDALVIVDESHVTVPQVRAMFAGDKSRKTTLVDHGFRLPCALDNRPLRFEEFRAKELQTIFVSATPADWELEQSGGEIVEQLIRPTGLVDPLIHVVPARGQVQHLIEQIRQRTAANERVLDAFERVEVLRKLRGADFDCVVGVNLLREGLDLPEVSLVAILDADKEGFLRSATSLIQTIGRSARNVNAEVYLYADQITDSMRTAIDETARRRELQLAYNAEHGITPETIRKAIRKGIEEEVQARRVAQKAAGIGDEESALTLDVLAELESQMHEAARNLDFELAAQLRDQILRAKQNAGQQLSPTEQAAKAESGQQPRGKGKGRGKRVPKPGR
ncbi:MAG: excinuclease ABC subunit UvrB [Planctomycetota bacterium]|nr:excinuclease ABC subunit UvrB [Planctomycetota bacterium]